MKFKRFLKGLIFQLSFFSIIPVPINANLEEIATYSYTAPLFVGSIAAFLDFIIYYLSWIFIGNAARYLLIAIVELFRGFNHLDGLFDLGDALMIKGNREDKIRALKDVNIGTGGLGFLIVYFSIFLAALTNLPEPNVATLIILLVAEVESRNLGLLLLTINPIPESNLGRIFHKYLSEKKLLLILESFLLILTPCNIPSFILLYYIFGKLGVKSIGGSSGDLAGFSITLSFPLFILLGELKCIHLLLYL